MSAADNARIEDSKQTYLTDSTNWICDHIMATASLNPAKSSAGASATERPGHHGARKSTSLTPRCQERRQDTPIMCRLAFI